MNIEGLDKFDNMILEVIKDQARLSFTEIGQKVGLSRVAVKNRMESLEEKGIIKGYETIIDSTAVPEGTKFFLDIEAYPQDYEDVLKILSKEKIVKEIYSVTGDCRIHGIGFAPNSRYLQNFVNSLYRSESGVRRISCHTVLSMIKNVDGGVEYEPYEGKKSGQE